MDLFADKEESQHKAARPLAARMRPLSIDDVYGQEDILGEGALLRRAIQADRLGSLILYGPPGCGKTSVAEVIANVTQRAFVRTSGVLANVAELRALIKTAQHRLQQEHRETILFIDEIHRFNKAQQDVLLPYVEEGTVTLVGATTHNPMFFINTPLTSRSMVFELKALDNASLIRLLKRALSDDQRGLGMYAVEAHDDALLHIATMCEGDARRALNALEVAVMTTPPDEQGVIQVSLPVAEASVQKKTVVYDHDEDGHYDTISAFIKSVRGSDPHAAIYWLAKMIYAGEDPRFIARRLIILASEDIGNADPRGLSLAVGAMHAVESIGMPEARITLAQVTTYLATAPKSNASYKAVEAALKDVEVGRSLPVPEHLKNKHVKITAGHRSKETYRYPHDYPEGHVEQEYVPTDKIYYRPTEQGYEHTIGQRMQRIRKSFVPPHAGEKGEVA